MAQDRRLSRVQKREIARLYIHSSIITKTRIYLLIFVVVTVCAVVDASHGTGLTWALAGAGLLVGTVIGAMASRMQRLEWDGFEKRVVGRFDALGVVVLVAYLVFSLLRARIVAEWVPARNAGVVSLAVMAGAMLGQVIGIRRGVLALRRRLLGKPGPEQVGPPPTAGPR